MPETIECGSKAEDVLHGNACKRSDTGGTFEEVDEKAFLLSDFLPEQLLSDFFRDLCSALGITFKVNSLTRTITLAYYDDIIADPTSVEFSDNISVAPTLTPESFNGYKIEYKAPSCQYINDYVKSLEGLTIKGTVNIFNQLPPGAAINDCYYVTSRKAWYIWNYDTELTVLNWIHHSFDHPLIQETIDENSEDQQFSMEMPLNTILMDYHHPVDGAGDKTINSGLRGWITPAWFTPCNFRLLPESSRSDDSLALLFYRGMVNDSNDETYPLGSNTVYDYDGNVIANQALTINGAHGIYETRLRRFIEFMLQSPGDYTFKKQLTPIEIANLDFFRWHKIQGVDYLLKEVRFNIRFDHITTAEITAIRRNMEPTI